MTPPDRNFAEIMESRPIRDYLSIGENAPYATTCSRVLSECAGKFGNPRLGMIAIDASIDLAMIEEKTSALHLYGARQKLEHMLDSGPSETQDEYLTSIQATQRLTDMDLWQAASRNGRERLDLDYDTALLYSYEALRHAKNDNNSKGLLAENIPVLLGRRALFQPMLRGWHARFSLSREDNRLQASSTENPNWDIAIYNPNDHESFVNPTKKIQIKSSSQSAGSRSAYEKAGVKVLSARDNGFHNPWLIIASCMKERWPSATKLKHSYLDKHTLNALTLRISEKLYRVGLLDPVPNQSEST